MQDVQYGPLNFSKLCNALSSLHKPSSKPYMLIISLYAKNYIKGLCVPPALKSVKEFYAKIVLLGLDDSKSYRLVQ